MANVLVQYPDFQVHYSERTGVASQVLSKDGHRDRKDVSSLPSDQLDAIAVHNRYFTLVPDTLFEETNQQAYLNQLGMPVDGSFGMRHLADWKGTLLFSTEAVPDTSSVIYSIWEPLFYQFRLLTERDPKSLFYAHLIPGRIYFIAGDHNNIDFFNTFETTEASDYLYFVLLAIQQWQKKASLVPVYISGHFTTDSPLYQLLDQYIQHLHILNDLPQLPNSADCLPHQYPDIIGLLQCVSSTEA